MEKSRKNIFVRIFDDKDSIPKQFFCKICEDVFKTPTRVKCGHSFCEKCILSARVKSCPECGKKSAFNKRIKNYILQKLIEELKVRCPKECGKIGKLEEIENHFKICSGKVEVDPLKESLKRMNNCPNSDVDDDIGEKELKRGMGNDKEVRSGFEMFKM